MPDVGLIALVPDMWESCWQSRHYTLPRLARYFHVVWCNPASVDEQYPRYSVSMPPQDDSAPRDTPPGFHVHRLPAWMPDLRRPLFLLRLILQERLRHARRHLVRQGCQDVWLSLWRPSYAPALDLVRHSQSSYHIDDEYTFSEVEAPLDEREARLIREVDQVFVSSQGLLDKKGRVNPHTFFVPNGVHYQAYVRPYLEPPDLQPIPHPRIGYVGVIKKQLDVALLLALAQRHRQWSFVFVGPQRHLDDIGRWLQQLANLPNVYFLGEKPVSRLPSYTQHMDVCLLCYKINAYTQFIYPLKLHESLASGRPCVGSPIRTLQAFGSIMRLATTIDEWSQAIDATLTMTARSDTEAAARRDVARHHDWDRLVHTIARVLCERLGPAYGKRFEARAPEPLALPLGTG